MLQNNLDVVALRLFSQSNYSQTQLAEHMGKLSLGFSESAYKRSLTRLHQLNLIEFVKQDKVLPGNVKFYRITEAGKDELEETRKFLA
jgi:DNA-binding PadR family transcriptional regulator